MWELQEACGEIGVRHCIHQLPRATEICKVFNRCMNQVTFKHEGHLSSHNSHFLSLKQSKLGNVGAFLRSLAYSSGIIQEKQCTNNSWDQKQELDNILEETTNEIRIIDLQK